MLSLALSSGQAAHEAEHAVVAQHASAQAADRRATIMMDDYLGDGSPARPAPSAVPQAALATPALHQDRLIGVIAVLRNHFDTPFVPEDAAVLEGFAAETAAELAPDAGAPGSLK